MCDICVMNRVKDRMLSRRDFFRTASGAGVAAGAALAGASLAPTPARAMTHHGVMDMTHLVTEDFPTFFGEQWLHVTQLWDFARDGLNGGEWRINEHIGTHMDAPLHFSADGQSVDEIPVERLVAPLCVVDIRAKAEADADAQLTPDDLRAWIARHGPIPAGACVAMLSGWDRHVRSAMFRNADEQGVMHFPGFHVEAAQMLMEEADVVGIAVDTLSLDHGPSQDIATHYAWLPTNRWGLECVANLAAVPAVGATIIAGAPKVRGASGGTTRVITLI